MQIKYFFSERHMKLTYFAINCFKTDNSFFLYLLLTVESANIKLGMGIS